MPAVAFVQASPLFHSLSDEQQGKLIAAGAVLDYGAAEIILTEGSADDGLYLIVEGSVSIRKLHENKMVELAALERPAVFGEMAVLTGRQRSASVVTRTDCKLVRLPGDVVRATADAAPHFGRLLATLMASRAKETEKKLHL